MSYILDALKKSETDRQRRDAPGVADLPAAAAGRGNPRWVWPVAGLLLVNIAVLLALLLRPATPAADVTAAVPPASAEPSTVAPQTEPTDPPAADPATTGRQAAAVPPPVSAGSMTAPEPPDAGDTSVAAATVPQATPVETSQAATAAATQPPAPPAANSGARADELTTFMEIRAIGGLSLPDLHLDIHVFSETPAERFVFINMSKYRESDALSEGPRVREITRDGVILEYRGRVFLLSRE